MKKNIFLVAIKFSIFVVLFLSGFVLGTSTVNAALEKFDVPDPKCPSGQNMTKPSPGIGPMPCGSNQCREDGYLYFTACLSESDCGKIGGTTDGGNEAGCSSVGGVNLFCCRASKNRCKASNDPSKLYLCTNEQQCESLGKIESTGGACDGEEYNTCCEIPDSATAPMKIIGEQLLIGTAEDPSGTQRDLFSGGSSGGTGRVQRAYEHIDNFCFTQIECSKNDGKFEKGNGCPFKGDQAQGYCVAPEPEYELQYPIFGVTKIAGLRNLIGLIFNGSIGLLLIISAIFFIWGAFMYLVSSVVKSIQSAKSIMVDSLVGLALGLGAYAILANVNPNLLSLNPSKIYMINRMNFYNVVYCNDLLNKNLKLMDAGTPLAPLSYSAQLKAEGFTKNIAEAKCGNEYFIEGADSLAVCMGQACGSGGGLCINCSTGLGKDCKSDSTVEHACADCKFGGNVITSTTLKPDQVWLYLFCENLKSGTREVSVEELANVGFKTDDSTKRSSGTSGGYVTNFCIKKFKMNADEIKKYADECKGDGGNKMGALMFVFIDNEVSGNGLDVYASIKRTQEQNPYQIFLQRAIGINALPVYFLIDSQTDNSYFFVNKVGCNTNLVATSLSVNEDFIDAFSLTENLSFRKMLSIFSEEHPEAYDLLISNAWTIEDVINIVEKGTPSSCGFTAQ